MTTVFTPFFSRLWQAGSRFPVWGICFFFFILSLGLRFWHLKDFNTVVFDEVHFTRFSSSYLTHTQFFENHPPLAKYIIAAGIRLSEILGLAAGDETHDLVGYRMAPFSYRWMNAIFGSFFPPLLAFLAYQLNGRRIFAFLTGLFASLEAMALVESRYALINIYIVLFGFLGFVLLFAAVKGEGIGREGFKRGGFLFLTALSLAASFSVKLSGLAFPLAVFLFWVLAKIVKIEPAGISVSSAPSSFMDIVHGIRRVRFYELALMAIVGLGFYGLIWIPHLELNNNMSFWEWQKYMIDSHRSVGGAGIHPYCSAWYTWPFLLRPIAYVFQTEGFAETTIFRDVHALGNPALWWLSSLAVFGVILFLTQRSSLLSSSLVPSENKGKIRHASTFWIAIFLLIGYTANLLPWLSIDRCTFLYHYMPAADFAILGLAWGLTEAAARRPRWGIPLLFLGAGLVIAGFVYWLPIYYGFPISNAEFYGRMWFPSWI